jgi:hypothetical protein
MNRPEGASYTSPGQRPGNRCKPSFSSPEGATQLGSTFRYFSGPGSRQVAPFQGLRTFVEIGVPGRCPGLSCISPSGGCRRSAPTNPPSIHGDRRTKKCRASVVRAHRYPSARRPWWARIALTWANAGGCDLSRPTMPLVVTDQSGASTLGWPPQA